MRMVKSVMDAQESEKQRAMQNLNREIQQCHLCRLHLTRMHALCGEGSLQARMVLVAQAPGKQEDVAGDMFIGPSGKVLDDLLGHAGVHREEIYMTNLVKCMLPKYRKPKQDEIEQCSRYLDRELDIIDPEVIVPLGQYATRYIFEKYHIAVPSTAAFATVYGTLSVRGSHKIYPLRHPAALLYHASLESTMKDHYQKLQVLQTPCQWYASCHLKQLYDRGQFERLWGARYCQGDWESCTRYQVRAQGLSHPESLLPNGTIDRALRERDT